MAISSLTITAPGIVELTNLPAEEPGPGQVAVKAHYSLISAGTERSMFRFPLATPFYPGYSLAGEIIAVGEDVAGFEVGDPVIANMPHRAVVVCDARFVTPIPANVDPRHACFFNVAAMAMHAVQLARVKFGAGVLLLGQGLIGQITTQIARIHGAVPIFVTDLDDERLELARKLGADRIFNAASDTERLARELAALPGGGPPSTIELTANPKSIDDAIALTRRGGTIVPGSMGLEGHEVNLFGRAWMQGITITGSFFAARPWIVSTMELSMPPTWPPLLESGEERSDLVPTPAGEYALFLQLLAHERVDVAPLITKLVSPQEAADRFAELVGPGTLAAVIDWTG